MSEHIVYSFVIDQHPKYAYQGWCLARSLQRHCGASPKDIHIQMTPRTPKDYRRIFMEEGYTVHVLEPFGDQSYCNKLAQLPNLLNDCFDRVVLLDTDTIAVGDFRPFIKGEALQAKPVDLPNPPTTILDEIYLAAGGQTKPLLMTTDAGLEQTYLGNANGGFYAIPSHLARDFSTEWRKWALWLLENDEPLRRHGVLNHVDQISVALAVQLSDIPFEIISSNENYFIHFQAQHQYFDPERPITLLHYHDSTMNVLGLIEPPYEPSKVEKEAITSANTQISKDFNNILFWDFRYTVFPERGSGVGSREDNLTFKRQLLLREGFEDAMTVLDVGCGDMQVIGDLDPTGYLGVDVSPQAIATARAARPDLQFSIYEGQDLSIFDMVLCFEVLIHQTSQDGYHTLINFLADHTKNTLIVSGYEKKAPHHMVYFYEPLLESLKKTSRFNKINAIGEHTDVTVYRCDI